MNEPCSRRDWAMICLAVTVLDAAAPNSAKALQSGALEAAPQAAHVTERVFVPSGGVVLASTLLTPAGRGPHRVVILISGSRDVIYSHDDPLPRRLVADGIAVLVLGKRGVGESTGDWRRETFEQRAKDVRRAIDFIDHRSDLDSRRLGIIGHSQGGWIAQIVAAKDARVAFVVLLAGPGQTVFDQILTDERIHLERRGVPQDEVEKRIRRLRKQLGLLSATAPACRMLRAHYLCQIVRFDPTPYLERIRIPVLALFGELDPMVPPEPNAELVKAGLARAGSTSVAIHVFPRANHVFRESVTGLRDEYHQLKPSYVAGFLDLVSGWIHERVRSDAIN